MFVLYLVKFVDDFLWQAYSVKYEVCK